MARACAWHLGPCLHGIGFEFVLKRLHPRFVVLLGDFNRRVTKQHRDCLEGHAVLEQFHGERIAEHVRVALDIGELEQLAGTDRWASATADFGLPLPVQKKYFCVRPLHVRERLHDHRRQGQYTGVPVLAWYRNSFASTKRSRAHVTASPMRRPE